MIGPASSGKPRSGPSIGEPLDRVDGPAKVTGQARYAAEFPAARTTYAVIVQSTIASGTLADVETTAAERLPGVLAVMTPANAPRLPQQGQSAASPPSGRALSLLQDTHVYYNGQPIAVVIAETFETATHAAHLVRARYRPTAGRVDMQAALPSAYPYTQPILGRLAPATERGDVQAALNGAATVVDAVYTTPLETHNPMEPHATMAEWSGDRLTLHDSTQYVYGVRRILAKTFGIAEDNVRVICDYVGGAFGSKGSAWSHVVLAAMAARLVRRPVKLVLSRRQMFGPVGAHPFTVQHVVLGAHPDGALVASRHITTSSTSQFEDWVESSALVTRMLYASPSQETAHRLVKLNVGTPTFNRAPGESTGTFALESAMDELAVALRVDPIALRLKNYADADPEDGRPWSSKSLRACYAQAADRFGWARRTPQPGSMRDADELIGWGMATATYPARRLGASALVRILPNGHALVQAATEDLGTGTYTVMTQVAADGVGLPPDRVHCELGDTNYPENPISAGSMTAASAGSAVHLAALAARDALVRLALTDPAAPVYGARPEDILTQDGRIALASDRASGESYEALIARHGSQPVDGRITTGPGDETKQYSMHAFGAVFAEVRVDPDLGTIRVPRVVGAYGVGRVLNAKTARSQLMGGLIYGIGMALLEETALDSQTGRYLNADLSEYLVPVNADIGDIDVITVDEVDPFVNPIGVKGLGEIGTTGVTAAVANAVYHATGTRIRSLPITLDKLLDREKT